MAIERKRKQWDIESFLRKIERGTVAYPEFQRGKVWSVRKKSEAIYSLLTIGLPDLILLEREDGKYWVLDGLQRISSIEDFYKNEYPLKFDEKISHVDCKLKEALEGKKFSDLPEELKERFLNAEIGVVIYSNIDSFEVAKEIFTRINYRPTPLSSAELLYTLSFDKEKSLLLKELGDKLSKRRLKGFALLARILANLTLLEEGLKEEHFKFSQYYDWLYRWLVKTFERYPLEEIEKRAILSVELVKLLKTEAGIDVVKAPYWAEFVSFLLRELLKENPFGDNYEEFFRSKGLKYLKKVQTSPDWIRNISEKNKQKPKNLMERFFILEKVFSQENP